MTEIIPPTPDDREAILRITRAAGVFTAEEHAVVEELWEAAQTQGAEGSGYFFTVYRSPSGEVAGYTCFGPHAMTEGTYDLFWLAVDPTAQGSGIGAALIEDVEARVRRRGGRLLVIETSDSDDYAPARRFYSRQGYSHEATLRDFYKAGESLVYFTKHL